LVFLRFFVLDGVVHVRYVIAVVRHVLRTFVCTDGTGIFVFVENLSIGGFSASLDPIFKTMEQLWHLCTLRIKLRIRSSSVQSWGRRKSATGSASE
jgi:hypothetical protein